MRYVLSTRRLSLRNRKVTTLRHISFLYYCTIKLPFHRISYFSYILSFRFFGSSYERRRIKRVNYTRGRVRSKKKRYSVTSGSHMHVCVCAVTQWKVWKIDGCATVASALCARKEVQLGSGAIHEFRGDSRGDGYTCACICVRTLMRITIASVYNFTSICILILSFLNTERILSLKRKRWFPSPDFS